MTLIIGLILIWVGYELTRRMPEAEVGISVQMMFGVLIVAILVAGFVLSIRGLLEFI